VTGYLIAALVGAGAALPTAVVVLRVRDVRATTPDDTGQPQAPGPVHVVLVPYGTPPEPERPREIPVSITVTDQGGHR